MMGHAKPRSQTGGISGSRVWELASTPTLGPARLSNHDRYDKPTGAMSVQEIMAELAKLNRKDLEQLDARLHELLQRNPEPSSRTWADALEEVVGAAKDLPADSAHNHDHYLHGTPKR